MGQPAQMRDGRAVRGRLLYGRKVKQIQAVSEIKAGHRVAASSEVLGNGNADLAPLSRDQHFHAERIARSRR